MNKVAVLIAAGSGMGADAAKALAKDGFKIAIMSSSGKGEKLAKKLKGIDLLDHEFKNIKEFINKVVEKMGKN